MFAALFFSVSEVRFFLSFSGFGIEIYLQEVHI